jgi:hypothetical protein
MRLTAYIPCYNAERTLAEVLRAITEQSLPPDEVLVIDDGSTDASWHIASRFADFGVRVLSQPCNRGLGAARNRALSANRGEILIGLDADVAPEPDFLACVAEAFRAYPNVGAICGRLIEAHTEGIAEQWRAAHMAQDHGPESLENPPLLYGCTTAIRRAVAHQVGGWNERFRNAYEDVDLSIRLSQARIATRYEAACRAYHLRSDTVRTVLDSFCRWHAPLGELAGCFDSVKSWIQGRAGQLPWQVFRERLSDDIQCERDNLLPLTILLPWWMTACDLEEFHKRSASSDRTIAEVARRLPGAARSALMAHGASEDVADWVACQIRIRTEPLVTEQSYFEASPAAAVAMTRISNAGNCLLPGDPAMWTKIRSSVRELTFVSDSSSCLIL